MLLLALCASDTWPPLSQKEESRGINANPCSWVYKPAVAWKEEVGRSVGGNGGMQLLKELDWDRGALVERQGLKRGARFWGRPSAHSELLEKGWSPFP